MLSQLQDNDIPRTLWADAACIDQSNTKEKELQIPLMTEIYAKASRVIVWLGNAQNRSSEALQAIRIAAEHSPTPATSKIRKRKRSLPASSEQIAVEPVSKPVNAQLLDQAIPALLTRPWFRRIWVREHSR